MKHIVIGFFLFLVMLIQPRVQAYDYTDCKIFVAPVMSQSQYLECLKDPYEFAEYFIYFDVEFRSDNKVISTQSVRQGENASAPRQPTKVGHTFNGWDRSFSDIQKDVTINAKWIKSQQVTFIDYNGTVLKIDYVKQGEDALPPVVNPRSGYQFAGWNGSYEDVTQDITVMAQYEPLVYTVTYLDTEENVIYVDEVEHNRDSTPPTPPTIEGKTFVQWSQGVTKITEDISVFAEYSTAIYQVRFYDNGNLIKTTNVEHGNNAVAPVMTKEGHDFQGWSSPITTVTNSVDVQAVWKAKIYDVYFYDEEDVLLSHQQISYNESASAPLFDPPAGQQLQSWDTSFNQVSQELHIYPLLETLEVHVYYMDGEDLLHQETLEYGNDCIGFTPMKVGHDFESWNETCTNLTNDVTLQAIFIPHQFIVRFMDFTGQVIKEETVKYDQAATAPEPEFPNYRFEGWNTSFDRITHDTVIRPLGELRTYRAVFKNYEGTTLCEFNVKYAEEVNCDPPERLGYTFKGWSDSLTITNDVTLIPSYEPLVYQVDFYVDGVLLKSQQVQYNYSATPPSVNLEAFNLSGWSKSLSNITSDMKIDAILEKKTYVVVFKVDQNTIKEQIVPHGLDAVPPSLVVKPGHTFTGWKDDYTNVTTHRAIEAQFDVNEYEVRFIVEGNVVDQQQVPYQGDAVTPMVDIEGHDVIGWRGEIIKITQDTDIHAILRVKRYTVTFADEDGIIKEEQVLFGEDATPPDEGPWDQDYSNIQEDKYIQRRMIPLEEIVEEEVDNTMPVLNIPTMPGYISNKGDRIRYEFEVDLQEYDIIGLNVDSSLIQFESTSFFNKEIRWIEVQSLDPVDFQLQNINTGELFTIEWQESVDRPIVLSQIWQQIVQFFTTMFT